MKIYIIGATGSGKTTLARKLSNKYNIKHYELDLIVFDDENNHIRRTPEEIDKLFKKIIKKENWIIEDVGRTKFQKGRELANKIYYIKLSHLEVYKRVVKRWFKQRMNKEPFNYPPTLFQLFDMIKTAKEYFQKENTKLEQLEKYKDKMIILNKKQLNQFYQ